jgi:hypothetical protein
MENRCHCGLPSITGLVPEVFLCQRHYTEYQWGTEWSKECVKKDAVDVIDQKTGKTITYVGLYPEEAVRNAYAQAQMEDFNTWDYKKYNEKVSRHKGILSAGTYRKPRGRKDYTRFLCHTKHHRRAGDD